MEKALKGLILVCSLLANSLSLSSCAKEKITQWEPEAEWSSEGKTELEILERRADLGMHQLCKGLSEFYTEEYLSNAKGWRYSGLNLFTKFKLSISHTEPIRPVDKTRGEVRKIGIDMHNDVISFSEFPNDTMCKIYFLNIEIETKVEMTPVEAWIVGEFNFNSYYQKTNGTLIKPKKVRENIYTGFYRMVVFCEEIDGNTKLMRLLSSAQYNDTLIFDGTYFIDGVEHKGPPMHAFDQFATVITGFDWLYGFDWSE